MHNPSIQTIPVSVDITRNDYLFRRTKMYYVTIAVWIGGDKPGGLGENVCYNATHVENIVLMHPV